VSDAGKDLAGIIAKLREVRENAPEPQPLTPQELEQIRVATERLRKMLLGVRSYSELRAPPVELSVVAAEPPTIRVGELLRGATSARERETRSKAGAPEALYDRDEIARVLTLWRNRSTLPQAVSQSSLARGTFPRTAVRRVIRLDDNGAFQLGPRGGLRLLGINGEFRAAPKRVSLRALERALGLEPLA
jgi:hypothetical protein